MDGAAVTVAQDGTVRYRASALGGCSTLLLAARLGYEPLSPPGEMAALFRRGHEAEERVREIVPGIAHDQEEAVLSVTRKISVVGHIDGIKWHPAGHSGLGLHVVEIKSQSQDAWDEYDRLGWEGGFFPRYKWQTSVYMHATGLPLLLIRYNRDTEQVAKHRITEPFYTEQEIRTRVLQVEGTASTGVLMSECDLSQYPCPYFYLHAELDRELVTDEATEQLAREYVAAAKDEKVGKGRKEAARIALREIVVGTKDTVLPDTGRKLATETGVKITFYMAGNPPALNKGALAADLPEGKTLDDYMTRSRSERLRVTIPKED